MTLEELDSVEIVVASINQCAMRREDEVTALFTSAAALLRVGKAVAVRYIPEHHGPNGHSYAHLQLVALREGA